MISNSADERFSPKEEGGSITNYGKNIQERPISGPFPTLEEPRVVRVSPSFGGKDRHSKVRTARGLRDRRIRLSAPTAIQLYDLQERLGLNQPSKAVDWLINAAQQAIDELPPLLQIPPENYIQRFQSTPAPRDQETASHTTNASPFYASAELLKSNGCPDLSNPSTGKGSDKDSADMLGTEQAMLHKSMLWNSNEHLRSRLAKELQFTASNEENVWMERNGQETERLTRDDDARKWNHTSSAGPVINAMADASFYQRELPLNASRCSSRSVQGRTSETEELHNYSGMPLASSMAFTSWASWPQLMLHPSVAASAIRFPPDISPRHDFAPKQNTRFQMFGLNMLNESPSDSVAAPGAFQLKIAREHPSSSHQLNS